MFSWEEEVTRSHSLYRADLKLSHLRLSFLPKRSSKVGGVVKLIRSLLTDQVFNLLSDTGEIEGEGKNNERKLGIKQISTFL